MNKEVTQKLLPMAVKWLSVLSKGENTQQRIRQVIDLKQAMEAARDKFTEINLVPMEKQGDKMLNVTKDSPEVGNFTCIKTALNFNIICGSYSS